MKRTTRSISLLLAVLMLLSLLPITAAAADGKVYGSQDFESFTAGQTLTASDVMSTAAFGFSPRCLLRRLSDISGAPSLELARDTSDELVSEALHL